MVIITDVNNPDNGPEYSPGSGVTLQCSIVGPGAVEPVVYTWMSTCSGNCFVHQQSDQSIIHENIIHSSDSGNHTCAVLDDVGNSGSATFEMQIIGNTLTPLQLKIRHL